MPSAFRLLLLNKAVRAFGYGFVSVVIGIYLSLLGAGAAGAVAALGVSLISGAALNIFIGSAGDRFGRRRAMALFGIFMAVGGILVAIATSPEIAMIGLLVGALSPTGSEIGPYLSLEQTAIAEVAPAVERARWYAHYNLVGTLASAAGSAMSAVPAFIAGGLPTDPEAYRPLFFLYAGLGLASTVIATFLPHEVEAGSSAPVTLSDESRRRVGVMSALFSVDSFASGLALQSFVALWFYTVYPGFRDLIPWVFAASGILTAVSFHIAARLGERYGLLETMVVTHIPANVLLILLPLAPGFPYAAGVFLARMGLSQMDVPTRQAYLAGIVAPSERTAANAVTNMARQLSQAAGPFVAAGVIASMGFAAPFIFAGTLKTGYDLAIYLQFRDIAPSQR